MPKFATGFIDGSADITYSFVDKEFLIESFPLLLNQGKIPSLWLWGSGINGSLGDNTTVNRSSPVQTVSAGTNWKEINASSPLSAVTAFSGIKDDGTLWMWGINASGELGDNTTVNRSSPVQTVSAGTNWLTVSGSGGIKTDGTLWVWGLATNGRLGDNSTTNKSSPVQTVSAGSNWRSLSRGGITAAIKTDGTLWTWGSNARGAIGDNTITNRSSPVQVTGSATNWKHVTVGNYVVGAVKTDGTLWTWGCNGAGQLGDNSTADKSSPVQTVSAGTNWRVAAAGAHQMSAIKTDGTLWTWGCNVNGNLGDNTTVNKSSPVQTISGGCNWRLTFASTGTNASTVSMGAIKSDGSLWMWGVNSSGELGNNTTTNASSPVQTVSGGTNWRSLARGPSNKTAAIRDLDAD